MEALLVNVAQSRVPNARERLRQDPLLLELDPMVSDPWCWRGSSVGAV